jgi:hypothetical protein
MTARPETGSHTTRRTPMQRSAIRPREPVFRLLHSTGEALITDRSEALARLLALPGAKLFVLAP